MPSAYLLVSHGSRDPRPQVAMEQLAQRLRNKALDTSRHSVSGRSRSLISTSVAEPLAAELLQPLVGTACLELSREPLHEQIEQFGGTIAGCSRLQVVPMFLLPGVHVMEDIPAEVAIAQQALGGLQIELRPYLGTHLGLKRLLAMAMEPKLRWILLAHGSSRGGAREPVEAMAAALGAVPAYWAVSPKLEVRVEELVSAGYSQIGVLPYFLFEGGITDAIARSVEDLRANSVEIHLAKPLGVSDGLVDLIWDLVER